MLFGWPSPLGSRYVPAYVISGYNNVELSIDLVSRGLDRGYVAGGRGIGAVRGRGQEGRSVV